MRFSTIKKGAAAVLAALAVTIPASASALPSHQAPPTGSSPLDDPDEPSCTVGHWHGWGYCEVEHPNIDPDRAPMLSTFSAVRAEPGPDGWRAEARLIAFNLDTGEIIKSTDGANTWPLDQTPPPPHDPTDPAGVAHWAVADVLFGHPIPTLTLAQGETGERLEGHVRVGCLVRADAGLSGSLTCQLLHRQ